MVQTPVQPFRSNTWSRLGTFNGSKTNPTRSPIVSQTKPSVYTKTVTKSSPLEQNVVYINDKIKAFEVIVISEDGESLWQMKRFDALQLAESKWLDLVQLSYNPVDKVCTAKITDFGKYLYEKKRITKEKKKVANKWMKQMKFAYGIWTNDLILKIKKIKELLDEWYTMRVFVQLKWRENIYKDKIIEKFMFIQESLKDCAKTQTPQPKQDKNTYSFFFTSLTKK
jgi:translation initiation factor IF-3